MKTSSDPTVATGRLGCNVAVAAAAALLLLGCLVAWHGDQGSVGRLNCAVPT